MKKTAVFLLLFLIPVLLPAQVGNPKFIAGISLANFHSVTGPYPEVPAVKTGLMAGIGGEVSFPRFLGEQGLISESTLIVEIDLLYIQKGCQAETGSIRGKFNLEELSLPFLFKYKFSPASSPFILAGGEAALVLSYRNTEGEALDLKPFISSFDYGLIIGGGFQLCTDTFTANIEARYHYGLADLGKDESESHFKTSTFVIAASFLF